MQQQNRLRKYQQVCSCGTIRGGWFTAILSASLALIIISSEIAGAEDVSQDLDQAARQAAMRRKADECLSVAGSQIRQQLYEAALATLEECATFSEGLTSSQQRLLAKHREQASQGREAWIQADTALAAGDEHMARGELARAEAEYQKAYESREYLPESRVGKIKSHLEQVAASQRLLKSDMQVLFKQSVKQYKGGEYEQAQMGFVKIRDSGVKLGFFDRGNDFTDTQGYLKKIAKKIGDQDREPTVVVARIERGPAVAEPVMKEYGDDVEVITLENGYEPAEAPEAERGELTEDELVAVMAPPESTAEVSVASEPEPGSARVTSAPVAEKSKKKKFSLWPFGGEKGPSAETLEKVSELLAQGHLAMQDGNSALAEQYFAEALELHPESEAARRALAAAQYDLLNPQVDKPAKEMSIIERARAQQRVQRQAIEASFISARNNINRMLAQDRFEEARTEISQLLAMTEGAKQLLGTEMYQRLSGEARAMHELIEQQQRHYNEEVLTEQIRVAQEEELKRHHLSEAARQRKIEGLYHRALEFRDSREFEQAAKTFAQLLALDPKHQQATFLREDMEMMQMLIEQEKVNRRSDYEEAKLFINARASAIPWSDTMTFGDPEEWLAKRNRRELSREEEYSGSPQKRKTLKILDTETISLDYLEDTEFRQILEDIREEADLNFIPHWNSLETGEIFPGDTIAIQATDIPVGTALDYVLAEVSAGKFETAGYVVDDQGIINIDIVSVLGEDYKYYEKVFSIVDLLNVDPSNLPGQATTSTTSTTTVQDTELTIMIKNTVYPETWSTTTRGTSGGREEDRHASISISGNNLVVRQTREGHRKIEELLKSLRSQLTEQVQIEVRFLVINSNFLEDIGLDFDIYLNLDNAGYDFGPGQGDYGQRVLTPRADPGPWNRTTPLPIQSEGAAWAAPVGTGVPGTLGGDASVSAFRLAGSFLDNVQVDFLMRATQAHQRSRSLVAPHMTVISGQPVSISFNTQVSYVAGYTAESDDNVILPVPNIGQLGLGISLNLTPTLSANKRYVLLNFNVSQQTLLRMANFTFAGTRIQLPEFANNSLSTRVSVPDGGTLLLGGQKLTAEVEKEIGVPALSKIPIINRLFTNRSIVRDESVLLILVKPTIILQSEEEEERFGSLSQ